MLKINNKFILSKLDSLGINKTSSGGNWKFSCPICREGKSFGKKKRCFLLKDGYFMCFNCSKAWSAYNFFNEICKISLKDFISEHNEYINENKSEDTFSQKKYISFAEEDDQEESNILPFGSINLEDKTQVDFYKNSYNINSALEYCKRRRLFDAINKVPIYFTSKDYIHKDRIVLPYYKNGKIVHYQSRLIKSSSFIPKYLSKPNSKKCFFNEDNIDWEYPYIFIFEGPIDSMFVKNGIAMGGLTCNAEQKEILNFYKITKEIIYVLDNQIDNKEVVSRYLKLEEQKERVFLWSDIEEKDINEWTVKNSKNLFDSERIVNDSGSPLILLNR